MTTKVILLFVLFFVNLFGFFSLTSTLINCPFRVFFGGKNHKSGSKNNLLDRTHSVSSIDILCLGRNH